MKTGQRVLHIAIPAELNDKLGEASEKLGLMRTAIVRMLIEAFLAHYDANGGKITLPLVLQSGQRADVPHPKTESLPVVRQAKEQNSVVKITNRGTMRRILSALFMAAACNCVATAIDYRQNDTNEIMTNSEVVTIDYGEVIMRIGYDIQGGGGNIFLTP